jgi:predicted nuclease of predicted toxin-antitoxin system
MTIWVDAQLSLAIAKWISDNFTVSALAVRDLGLREATDQQIFAAAKDAGAIVMTKDIDFIQLLDKLGPPPQIIWITCGNTSNARLKELLTQTLQPAIALLQAGESLVEISGV